MNKKRKVKSLCALALCLILVLASCSSGQDSETSAGGSQGPGVQEGGSSKDNMVVATIQDPISMSPWYAVNQGNYVSKNMVYERLFYVNAEGEIVPQLAESWKWNEDQTVLEVSLRKGVLFHNGEEMTAEDVKYSLQYGCQEPIITAQIDCIDYENIVVVDDYNLEIPMLYSNAVVERSIAGCALFIVNEKWAKENGEDFTLLECGTGPFVLESYEPNVELKYIRNENYWGELAKVSTVQQRIIDEASQALMELENGQVDLIISPGMANVNTVENTGIDANVIYGPSYMNLCLYFNMDLEPVNNKLVRQAIWYALKTDEAVAAAYYNLGTVASSFLASGVWGYEEKYETEPVYTHNLEKAKELLTQAGYPDGFTMNIYVSASELDRVTLTEVIQNNLAEVGITVNVKALEYSAFRAALVEGVDNHAFIFGLTATTLEPDNAWSSRFMGDIGGTVGMYGWEEQENGPVVSDLLQKARETFDETERLEIYSEVEALLFEEAPVIPLSEAPLVVISASNLKGLEFASEYYWFQNVYFE